MKLCNCTIFSFGAMLVPVIMEWRVLGLRMDETYYYNINYYNIILISDLRNCLPSSNDRIKLQVYRSFTCKRAWV